MFYYNGERRNVCKTYGRAQKKTWPTDESQWKWEIDEKRKKTWQEMKKKHVKCLTKRCDEIMPMPIFRKKKLRRFCDGIDGGRRQQLIQTKSSFDRIPMELFSFFPSSSSSFFLKHAPFRVKFNNWNGVCLCIRRVRHFAQKHSSIFGLYWYFGVCFNQN